MCTHVENASSIESTKYVLKRPHVSVVWPLTLWCQMVYPNRWSSMRGWLKYAHIITHTVVKAQCILMYQYIERVNSELLSGIKRPCVSLPFIFQVGHESQAMAFDPEIGERAMLLGNQSGDWAVCVARWHSRSKGKVCFMHSLLSTTSFEISCHVGNCI